MRDSLAGGPPARWFVIFVSRAAHVTAPSAQREAATGLAVEQSKAPGRAGRQAARPPPPQPAERARASGRSVVARGGDGCRRLSCPAQSAQRLRRLRARGARSEREAAGDQAGRLAAGARARRQAASARPPAPSVGTERASAQRARASEARAALARGQDRGKQSRRAVPPRTPHCACALSTVKT